MTTTETPQPPTSEPPTSEPPTSEPLTSEPLRAPVHELRRSRSDRVVAGVAGGLGEYFRVDPVLFRVLFAVTAFFGGAGLLAYVLGWALIPEPGATSVPLDRAVNELRRRRIPIWAVAAAILLTICAATVSWWTPNGFFPAVVVLVALFVYLVKRPVPADLAAPPAAEPMWTPPAEAGWSTEAYAWPAEQPAAQQVRRRRSGPVVAATLTLLVLALTALGITDAIGGIVLPAYLWTALTIVLAGLTVGALLRRTPWSLLLLLVPISLGLIAFGGSSASLHDGVGQRTWAPSSSAELADSYRLAFGQSVLDLRRLPTLDSDRTVRVELAAGQTEIRLPADANVEVRSHVRFGSVDANGRLDGGNDIERTVPAPATATGPRLTLDVSVLEGEVTVRRG